MKKLLVALSLMPAIATAQNLPSTYNFNPPVFAQPPVVVVVPQQQPNYWQQQNDLRIQEQVIQNQMLRNQQLEQQLFKPPQGVELQPRNNSLNNGARFEIIP